jgi:hypothetical protein
MFGITTSRLDVEKSDGICGVNNHTINAVSTCGTASVWT